MNQNWGIVACIGGFALTFGFAMIASQRGEVAKPAPVVKPAPAPEKETLVEPPPKPIAKKDGGVAKPPKPSRPILIKQWQGTQPPKPKGEDSPNFEDFFYRQIAMDKYGARILGYTNREAVCWDAIGGTRLQTLPAATRTTPRKPPNPPDFHIDQHIRISADAKRVAMIDKNGKSVTIYDAASGARIGTFSAPKDRSQYTDHYPPEFTPRGTYLIFCTSGGGNKDEIYAVSASSATGRRVDLGRAYTAERYSWIALIPFADGSTFFCQQQGDAIQALNLSSGKERPLNSTQSQPFTLFENAASRYLPPVPIRTRHHGDRGGGLEGRPPPHARRRGDHSQRMVVSLRQADRDAQVHKLDSICQRYPHDAARWLAGALGRREGSQGRRFCSGQGRPEEWRQRARFFRGRATDGAGRPGREYCRPRFRDGIRRPTPATRSATGGAGVVALALAIPAQIISVQHIFPTIPTTSLPRCAANRFSRQPFDRVAAVVIDLRLLGNLCTFIILLSSSTPQCDSGPPSRSTSN